MYLHYIILVCLLLKIWINILHFILINKNISNEEIINSHTGAKKIDDFDPD